MTKYIHCVSKKVPIFKLSVTLSNLNRLSKFLHSWKVYEICYNSYDITYLTLGMLLHYLGKLKFHIFSKYSAVMEENAHKLHFMCTNFNFCMHVTVYAECIYVFLSKSCPRHWIPCWSLTNTAVTSAVTNFQCHKLTAKVNK